ncbi:MAG TPA: twin-arginine translocase TatA/TatE family subunit [Ktedonobacterales bacterium]|nr:twin-arginine translocase TatA/TatE family subunit [Ktedonobacterales bacterium]
MGGFHWPELVIIVVIALLVFGPKRLPEMGSSVGKTIREFQRSMREVTEPKGESAPPQVPPASSAAAQVSAPQTQPQMPAVEPPASATTPAGDKLPPVETTVE